MHTAKPVAIRKVQSPYITKNGSEKNKGIVH